LLPRCRVRHRQRNFSAVVPVCETDEFRPASRRSRRRPATDVDDPSLINQGPRLPAQTPMVIRMAMPRVYRRGRLRICRMANVAVAAFLAPKPADVAAAGAPPPLPLAAALRNLLVRVTFRKTCPFAFNVSSLIVSRRRPKISVVIAATVKIAKQASSTDDHPHPLAGLSRNEPIPPPCCGSLPRTVITCPLQTHRPVSWLKSTPNGAPRTKKLIDRPVFGVH